MIRVIHFWYTFIRKCDGAMVIMTMTIFGVMNMTSILGFVVRDSMDK